MHKKFHETQISKIFSLYSPMRSYPSAIMVFLLIQHFGLSKILEMGFHEGLTFGVMLEATGPGAELTSFDIDVKIDLYNKYYRNSEYVQDKQVHVLEVASENFVPQSTYDFINVDVDTTVSNDESRFGLGRARALINASKCISQNGIIMLDDYQGQSAAIDDLLATNCDFVPFLVDDKAMYFHHVSHDANDFLDSVVEDAFVTFCNTSNIEYQGHLVKQVVPRPLDIVNIHPLFQFFIKEYNI